MKETGKLRSRNLYVMSRKGVIRYCHEHHANKAVIISISDPLMVYDSAPFSSGNNGVVGILRLCFADADGVGSCVWVPHEADTVLDRPAVESDLMTKEDAKRVARFLKMHSDVDIIVHCDAGLSRSTGVAAAIMKHVIGDDSPIFDSGRYYPNMWCYRLTLEALENEEE